MTMRGMRQIVAAVRSRAGPAIERASATDLAMLAMDAGPLPQQLGAALTLNTGPDFDLPGAERLIAERVHAVPRLRQRLVSAPAGCGRPVWVDDPDFDIGHHVRRVHCPSPGDERALLDVIAAVVSHPLPRSRPLWSAVFVTGLTGHSVALVMVFHHVLADGIGGLAVLASIVDQAAQPAATPFPRRPPPRAQLAIDAVLTRVHAPARLPVAWRNAQAAVAAAGGLHADRVASCSLIHPTGPRRRLAVVRADLAELRGAAHRHGATVNDVVLAAVTGALRVLLDTRRESVDTLFVAVPVAARRSATATQLGNETDPMVVPVPATGDLPQRLRQITLTTRARRTLATGPPTIALLGPVFRAAASLGLYHWYMNHQRRMHTLVSNVRGPDRPLTFAGATIDGVIPVAVGEAGNMTVSFIALSYAGTLAITVVADPEHVPDLSTLTTSLQAEIAALVSPST